jgi:hypothetical protein
MGDRTRGLYAKFIVTRTDGSSGPGGKHDDCPYFVLDAVHDPCAAAALRAYAAACEAEYPLLAADLRRGLIQIAERVERPAPAAPSETPRTAAEVLRQAGGTMPSPEEQDRNLADNVAAAPSETAPARVLDARSCDRCASCGHVRLNGCHDPAPSFHPNRHDFVEAAPAPAPDALPEEKP